MARKDRYYNKAKQEGYRTRAAYKLIQLDEQEDVLAPGAAVVDLGAAPGGWLQVAAKEVGAGGTVVGVDRQSIDPLVDADATVSLVQGDVTESETLETIRGNLPDGTADVVLSDMAPEMTGEYPVDQARSIHLAEQALAVAESLLAPEGDAVVKIFEGRDVSEFRERMARRFEYVAATSPDASRDASSELYLIGKGFLDPPVSVDDRLVVEIVDEGSEGDGIAHVEGYTLFVPETEVGERVEIAVDDVKSTFGFAHRVE